MATVSSIRSPTGPCRCYIGSEPRLATLADAKQAAAARGLRLTIKTIGPAYRVACHDGGHGDESGPLVAESSGFLVRPLKLQHCDSMRIFNRKMSAEDRQRIRGGSFWGLSLIVVVALLAHGYELGCTKAEALAINDDDYQHRRLVKFYTRMGFEPKFEVKNNGLADLPHLLVWGGAGTRIDGDIRGILSKWGPKMRQLADNGAAGD